jgi:hypothetical protein
MNLDLIMEIAELALSLVNNALNGAQSSAAVTSTLLQILQKGAQAYQQHTGQALDPSLIHAEAPI